MQSYSEQELDTFDKILFINSDLLGPIQTLEPLFKKLKTSSSDVYYLENIYQSAVSQYFFSVKREKLFYPLANILTKNNNLIYSSFFHNNKESDISSITDNIINGFSPFVYKEILTENPTNLLQNSMGQEPSNIINYIQNSTDYPIQYIWEDLISNVPMSILKNNFHQTYILSTVETNNHQQSKVALILYIYYKELIPYCYKYALSMPQFADIYIVTTNMDLQNLCKKHFKDFPCNNLYFRQMKNRGRDVAAYLIVCKDVFYKYDYICCMHDKKSPQYTEATSRDFSYHLFESNLSSSEYVYNILDTFNKNCKLGMLIPFYPNFSSVQTVGNPMYKEGDNVKKLLSKLNFGVPFDFDVCAPLGTMFWVRGKAFLPMFNYDWKYEDFPAEPNKSTGTLLHAIERFYPFASQEAGYFVGSVIPLKYMPIYFDNFYWYAKENIKKVLLDNKTYANSYLQKDNKSNINNILVGSSTDVHFKDVKKCIKNYIQIKIKKILQRFKHHKKQYNRNAYINYIELINGRVVLSIFSDLSNLDSSYIQCGIFKYFSKKELTWQQIEFKKYREKDKQNVIFFDIPLYNILNNKLYLTFSDKQKVHLDWACHICYNALEFGEYGLSVRIAKGALYIEKKLSAFKHIVFSSFYSLKDKLLFLFLKINPIHKYVLFSENMGAADNSFQLFKYAVKKNTNCYYLTTKEIIDATEDKYLKKHMIIFNSKEHIIKFFLSKAWVTSFSLVLELFPQIKELKDIHYASIPAKWFFVPHGITSGDKTAMIVHKYSWMMPSVTFCCSKKEAQQWQSNYEFKNTCVSGYPRMDKWFSGIADKNKIILFFTWRYDMRLTNNDAYKNSPYMKTILQIVNTIKQTFPKKQIYYVFHHEVVKSGCDKIIKQRLGDKNISYIYFNTEDGIQEFNKQFRNAKYLVTDYSSVAYDFAYKEGSIPIYYLDNEFISGHYPLEQRFYDIHLGVIAKTKNELIKALLMPTPTKEMKRRRKEFFEYIDNKNCERVYDAIFTK